MVARGTVCLRRLGDGEGCQTKRFRRFLANDKVSVAGLIESWAGQTGPASAGRHVLAIQDTSEINFRTRPGHERGLGEIGKGGGRGALLHAMLAADAETGGCLGLVAGSIYTRQGRVETPHGQRALADKESRRWLDTAGSAKAVLAQAARVTVVADRESDIYAEWATLPAGNFHLLTRVMHDRAVMGGGTLASRAETFTFCATRTIELQATAKRLARTATLGLRFGTVEICRPPRPGIDGLPEAVSLTLVEVIEHAPPAGVEPVHWRLLTTHAVADEAAAWQIVDWYRQRWIIEQFFRVLKTQGFRIEDSQLDSADLLLKLIAIAAKAAAITLQLLQARDGRANLPATAAFDSSLIPALAAINARYQAKTVRQKNPYPQASMAWAAWIIARLGGWDGYRSSRPPGPITFKNGLDQFHAIAIGWALRDLSTP
jgi:Transposase DDE domain